ncbi:MAG: Gfo/Idh/MocA family oxidoreductase [Oceanicaulis sp.]|nr:Gfo/Idh/MocA family oxidoreductase [Oceanicaulis sp.]
MKRIAIGVAGLGFAGALHARAVEQAARLDRGPGAPALQLAAAADPDPARRAAAARAFPAARLHADWQALVQDRDLDAVVIALPNDLHADAGAACLAAGKAVLIEKPLAPDAAGVRRLAHAAVRARRTASAGYVFRHSPALAWAIAQAQTGAFGELHHIALTHAEDYGAAGAPLGWRGDAARAGYGALGDLGAHAISIGIALCGPVASAAAIQSPHPETGLTDDRTSALLAFTSGAQGSLHASRTALGRKMRLAVEISADRASLVFDHERPNEIDVCMAGQPGFVKRLCGPDMPGYDRIICAAGHGLGFADLFTLQMEAWTRDIAAGAPGDLGFALQVEASLQAVRASARTGAWTLVQAMHEAAA